jgi:hypothetical protein
MKYCWAECLGDCSGKISKEHIVSRGLFDGDALRVFGFSWCKDEEKEISLPSLTAKILCVKHNNDLSEVDTSGANAFAVFREMRRLTNVREKMTPRRWRVVRCSVNGSLLERWFLKTLINISTGSEYPIGKLANKAGQASEELVNVAFGRHIFTGRSGLYSAVHVGQMIHSSDKVEFSPLIKEQNYIAGGLFSFRGFRFLLFLDPEGPPERLTGIGFPGDDWSNSQLNYHNKKIKFTLGKYLSQVMEITW